MGFKEDKRWFMWNLVGIDNDKLGFRPMNQGNTGVMCQQFDGEIFMRIFQVHLLKKQSDDPVFFS